MAQPMQAYIPISFGAPGSGPGYMEAPPNMAGDAETIFQLALEAARSGNLPASNYLVDKAAEAERSGGRTQVHIPGMNHSQGIVRDLAMPMMKSMAANALKPVPTPSKYSEFMDTMGVYDGIKNPEDVTGRSFAFLEALTRNPSVEGVIRTRISQATRFCRIVNPLTGNGGVSTFDGGQTGYCVVQKADRARMTPVARREMERIQNLIQHGGFYNLPGGEIARNPRTGERGVWDGAGAEKAFNFRDFIAILIRQSLTWDFVPVRQESGGDPKAAPVAFFRPTDSKRVRVTIPSAYGRPRVDPRLKEVQWVEMSPSGDGTVVREFNHTNMDVWIRHQKLDWFGKGYGCPEGEWLIDTVAALVMGFNYQRTYFDSSPPDSIVSLIGQPGVMAQQTIELLQQQIQMKSGIDKWNRVLFLAFPPGSNPNPLNVTPLRKDSNGIQEMGVLREWFVLLNAIVDMIYGIHPEEVGFEGVTTSKPTMSDEDPASSLQHSQEKGFIPLMESAAGFLNYSVIERINPDFVLQWVNLHINVNRDPKRATLLMEQGYTPNQVNDLQDVPRFLIPLDPQLHRELAAKMDEEDFDTDESFQDEINRKYEKKCKAMGVEAWSKYPDMPVGNPSAMEIIRQELAENAQRKAAADPANQDEPAPVLPPDPNAAAGQEPGEDPNAMQEQPMAPPLPGEASVPQPMGPVPPQIALRKSIGGPRIVRVTVREVAAI